MSDLLVGAAGVPVAKKETAAGPSFPLPHAIVPRVRWLDGTPLDFKAYQAQGYIPALDGMRGVAIALVITRHLHKRMWDFLSGSVGVTIFFILSGYLITRLALQEERRTGRLDLASFYLRRSFRLFPMYYLVLAIYTGLILGTHLMPAKAATFPILLRYYVTYLQELPVWGLVHLPPGDLPFYQSWSLGIEEKFYLVWPVLMVAIGANRRSWRVAVALLLASVCVLQGLVAEGRRMYNLEHYAYIFFGVVLALVLSAPHSYHVLTTWARRLAAPALVVMLGTQFVLTPHTSMHGLFTLYALATTVMLTVVLTSEGLPARVLSTPALTLLGRISYGVYLLHILCLVVVERFLKPERGIATGVLAYAVTLLLSIVVAYAFHISFEKPMIELGRRLSRRQPATRQRSVSVKAMEAEAA